jgi:hypothetical protein
MMDARNGKPATESKASLMIKRVDQNQKTDDHEDKAQRTGKAQRDCAVNQSKSVTRHEPVFEMYSWRFRPSFALLLRIHVRNGCSPG